MDELHAWRLTELKKKNAVAMGKTRLVYLTGVEHVQHSDVWIDSYVLLVLNANSRMKSTVYRGVGL